MVDQIDQAKNRQLAWERVKANRGAGGVDGVTLADVEARLEEPLKRLPEELRTDTYRPPPVRQKMLPKPGKSGELRPLGIPTIDDRVCQQALLNRLEPIVEAEFEEANFGYRQGRSAKAALRKVWREIEGGSEGIVEADLKDFFGTVDHAKLMTLVARKVADGRVRRIIDSTLKAGCAVEGRQVPTTAGTPPGAGLSPVLSHMLLTPLDWEMRRRGYQLTRSGDDGVVTGRTRAEAKRALAAAEKILAALGVRLNPSKTRIVHVRHGFAFLGDKIKRGSQPLRLAAAKITSGARPGARYAYPTEQSLRRFKDRVRRITQRKVPLTTEGILRALNPVIRGWGLYDHQAHLRRLFNRLERWMVQRMWSHRDKRWRCGGWKELPETKLYGERGLENLIALLPSLASRATLSS